MKVGETNCSCAAGSEEIDGCAVVGERCGDVAGDGEIDSQFFFLAFWRFYVLAFRNCEALFQPTGVVDIPLDNISVIVERYVNTPQDVELALHGARDSMAIDRAYRGALGYYMEQIK